MWKKIGLFVLIIIVLGIGYKVYKYNGPYINYKKMDHRVVVIGLDGMEPSLTEKWMKEGKLPNLSKLAASGTYQHLGTTNPAESPVSWASFITGSNPGKHGIFDFLTRDPQTYNPELSILTPVFPKKFLNIGEYKFPLENAQVINHRSGTPIWEITKQNNIHTMCLHVPDTFPAEEISGEMLSGLGVPDIRATWGTFTYYSNDVDDMNTEMGGKLVKVNIVNDKISTSIFGPKNRFRKTPINAVMVPMEIQLNRAAKTIEIEIQGQKVTLKEGDWSPWMKIGFPMLPLIKIHGMTRFCFINMGPEFKLYCAPINFDPENPPFRISYPERFGKQLVKSIGLYKTLGWAEDTWALTEDRISEDIFLQDLYYTFETRKKLTLQMLREHKDVPLFISVFEGTDRIQHTFYRFIDPKHPMYTEEGAKKYGDEIMKFYIACDTLVGEVQKELGPKDTLIVLSDHGFHTWRYSVNVNTWLVQNGFMKLNTDSVQGGENLDKLFGHGAFFQHVDWSQTRAFSMGLGKIYINLMGRERDGIVVPGKDYEDTRNEIIAKIKTMKNPLNKNELVIRNVYKRDEIYHGPYVEKPGDLVLGFNDGYRISWQTSLGGAPKDIIELNKRKWSGDHCSVDPSITAGVIFTNQKIDRADISIMDLAPTMLHLLGIEKPKEMDGTAFVK